MSNAVPADPGLEYRYQQITAAIRDRIAGGAHAPGDRLPSIGQLAAEFGTSSITVRRAMKDLALAGLVTAQPGRGHFIARHRRIRRRFGPQLGPMNDMASDIRAAGYEPGLRVLDVRVGPADEDVARRLNIARGATAYRTDSVVLADGEPIALDRCHLPAALGDAVRDRLRDTFLITLLLERGTAIGRMELDVTASSATDAERLALGVPTAFPLLTVAYTPFGQDGRPLLSGEFTSRSDRITYQVSSQPGDAAPVPAPGPTRTPPRRSKP